jgi:hypothetical protein
MFLVSCNYNFNHSSYYLYPCYAHLSVTVCILLKCDTEDHVTVANMLKHSRKMLGNVHITLSHIQVFDLF